MFFLRRIPIIWRMRSGTPGRCSRSCGLLVFRRTSTTNYVCQDYCFLPHKYLKVFYFYSFFLNVICGLGMGKIWGPLMSWERWRCSSWRRQGGAPTQWLICTSSCSMQLISCPGCKGLSLHLCFIPSQNWMLNLMVFRVTSLWSVYKLEFSSWKRRRMHLLLYLDLKILVSFESMLELFCSASSAKNDFVGKIHSL